ncbi:galactokinase [Bacillus sp. DNRA2]|uniref:galactokinase n=1 Tax=Bacillus sp. DNRA2 TaxID=2723053 RepID=UPI00145D3CDE|nr:galactokinase [Bacillus sp. DNRA2]
MDFRALASDFQTIFSREAERYFFSPGRVNLIGEHTEYNGANVLPCAISLGIYGAVSKRTDRLVRLFSKNFSEQGMIQFTLDELNFKPSDSWANYPKGMLSHLHKEGHILSEGFDLLVSGNIPVGAGLSSSASLLMLIGETVNKLYQLHLSKIELIKACKETDQYFIGMKSGIGDPFIVANGKVNHAILLDCHTLSYDYIPFHLQDYKLVIMNSNKQSEELVEFYDKRRDECEHALRHLQGAINILSLGDLNIEQFESFKHLIPTELLKKRARHVVTENERAFAAVKQLRRGNLKAFGELMTQSHLSLQNNYEATGTELDTLVECASSQPGVLGAKMTGAGLGGCAIAIVEAGQVDHFIEEVNQYYVSKIGRDASFYTATIGDGVRELNFDKVK